MSERTNCPGKKNDRQSTRNGIAKESIGPIVFDEHPILYLQQMIGNQAILRLSKVIQQASDPTIRRTEEEEGEEISNIDRLEQLLENDQEEEAIAFIGQMSQEDIEDVNCVLLRTDLRDLAVRAFNNEEMYRAVRAMRGASLFERLQWMFAEGTNWEQVQDIISSISDPTAPDVRRVRDEMQEQLARLCNNEEMASATSHLGGGDLEWELGWMRDEGTSWGLVEPKLSACTDPDQKVPIRECTNYDWKNFFIRICNNEEMADAVNHIGGDLTWKFDWMLSEGTNADLLIRAINNAGTGAHRESQLEDVIQDQDLCQRIYEGLSAIEARRVFDPNLIGEDTFRAASLLRRQFLRDLVVSDQEATQALRLIASAADVDQEITRLKDLGRWNTLLNNLPTGSSLTDAQKRHVRTLFDSSSCDLDDCKEMFEIRFDTNLVNNPDPPWDRPSLAAIWDQLDILPDSLVADNPTLDTFTRHTDPNLAVYTGALDRITIPGSAPTAWWGNDLTVVHEVGHAVDDLIDAEEWYMQDANIDWENYGGDTRDWLDAIIASGGWGPVAQADEQRQIRQVFLEYYDDPENTTANIDPPDPGHPWNVHSTCPVVIVGRENQGANIIFDGQALTDFGGRVFNRYPDYEEFYSFAAGAQNPPDFVSAYGLSSPYDWFAEQFKDYYSTTPHGTNRPVWIKDWLDNNLP